MSAAHETDGHHWDISNGVCNVLARVREPVPAFRKGGGEGTRDIGTSGLMIQARDLKKQWAYAP